MKHSIDFKFASSEAIIAALGQRLDAIRLSRNISQADLADLAGVSRSTLTRLADGRPISLDSFVRVMQALQLSDQLAALLPDPNIRPVEQFRNKKPARARASGSRGSHSKTADVTAVNEKTRWQWGDERKKS